MKSFSIILILLVLTLFDCVVLCASDTASNATPLQVSFADANWDGKKIPKGQQCKRFGGNGSTPRLTIKNIPPEASAIILEYSDRDNGLMDNGGHGKIGYKIQPGTNEVTISSVPGHTFTLPEGFYLVAAHGNPSWDTAGAYMPPCSGGQGNLYYVTIKAVIQPTSKDEKAKVLGTAELNLGRY